jgi:hypothetical protein
VLRARQEQRSGNKGHLYTRHERSIFRISSIWSNFVSYQSVRKTPIEAS